MGTKCSKVAFLDNGKVVTTGFSRHSDRQYSIWDQHDLKNPLHQEVMDSSSGVVTPYFDYDTRMVSSILLNWKISPDFVVFFFLFFSSFFVCYVIQFIALFSREGRWKYSLLWNCWWSPLHSLFESISIGSSAGKCKTTFMSVVLKYDLYNTLLWCFFFF